MIITHKLEMDMAHRAAMPKIDAVQGDSNTRVPELTLCSDGQAWTVPEGAAVWMRYCKSDGTKGIYDTLPDGNRAWTVQENVVTVTLAPQMLTAAGAVFAQMELVLGAATAATFTMQVNVQPNPAAGVLQSEEYINMLQWMEAELDSRLLQAKESGAFDGKSAYDAAAEAGYAGTEEEFAAMLNTPCLPLTGGTMTGELAMGGQKISGLGTPEDAADAVTKDYVDQKRLTLTVQLLAKNWSSSAPYTQAVMANGIQSTDVPRIEPAYTGVESLDSSIHAAYSCISYFYPVDRQLRFVCLENKPESDFYLMVEVLR